MANNKKLRVAGLDPSLSNFGMVKGLLDLDTLSLEIEAMQLVETSPQKAGKKKVRVNSDDLRRATELSYNLVSFVENTDIIFAEVPVGSQSSRAQTSYGICIALLASLPMPVIQLTPEEVKVTATGSKNATKKEMIDWAINLYPSAPWLSYVLNGETVYGNKNEHLADALGTIMAGIGNEQFLIARSMMSPLR